MTHFAHVTAPWRVPASRYYAHHPTCPQCITAGQGRGKRCKVGAELWQKYKDSE